MSILGDFVDTVKSVARPLAPIADAAYKTAEKVVGAHKDALRVALNNPVAQVAAMAASYVPGIGTGAASAIGALAAIGRGASLQDAALAAARASLPGQPASGAAFDLASGVLLKGQRLDAAGLAALREALPGGPAAQVGFDAALAAWRGRAEVLRSPAAAAALRALPNNPRARGAYLQGIGISKMANSVSGSNLSASQRARLKKQLHIVKAVSVPKTAEARAAFSTGVLVSNPGKISKPTIVAYAKELKALGAKGKQMANANRAAAVASAVTKRKAKATLHLVKASEFVRKLDLRDGKANAKVARLSAAARQGNKGAKAALAIVAIARKATKTHPSTLQRAKGAVASVANRAKTLAVKARSTRARFSGEDSAGQIAAIGMWFGVMSDETFYSSAASAAVRSNPEPSVGPWWLRRERK